MTTHESLSEQDLFLAVTSSRSELPQSLDLRFWYKAMSAMTSESHPKVTQILWGLNLAGELGLPL